MRSLVVTASTLLLLAACGGSEVLLPAVPSPPEGSDPAVLPMPEEEAPGSLSARLARGIELGLSPADSGFTLTIARGQAEPEVTNPLALMAGATRLSIDGEGLVSLSDLRLELDEIVLGPETFPPHGLHVVDVVAELELDVVDSDVSVDRAFALFTAEARLHVSWALLDRLGQRVKLRPIEANADVGGLYFVNDEGRAELELTGAAPGSLLLVADMFSLSDAAFSLRLTE